MNSTSPQSMHLKVGASIFALVFAASFWAHPQADNPSKDRKRANAAQPANMNCEQMSAASHGSISVDACQQMTSVQQAMTAALADPSASRPGDDKMTCEQIAAEMKQQTITPPDTAKVAEARNAVDDQQKAVAKTQKEGEAMVIKETAEASLASKIALTNAMGAAEAKKIEAEQKEFNERAAKELTPKFERTFNAFGNLTADMAKQLTANPRFAKLFQLANDKRCKLQ
jgi:hypothetical protein